MSALTSYWSVNCANRLGEGVVWDDACQCLWWTDIEAAQLFQLKWRAAEAIVHDLPHRLGSFALTEVPGEFVGAFEQGFARFRAGSPELEWIARPGLLPGLRFNDGRVDRQGRFVAGTMVEDPKLAGDAFLGKLYRLEADGNLTVLIEGLGITNALCWSPDGGTMYHADTRKGRLSAYSYTDEGAEFDRIVKDFSGTGAGPDGATVDAEGHIWVALWGAGKVVQLNPFGSVHSEVELPAQQLTCPAFGGPDLRHLAVTSARDGLSAHALVEQPLAGSLFCQEMAVRGLAEQRVRNVPVSANGLAD